MSFIARPPHVCVTRVIAALTGPRRHEDTKTHEEGFSHDQGIQPLVVGNTRLDCCRRSAHTRDHVGPEDRNREKSLVKNVFVPLRPSSLRGSGKRQWAAGFLSARNPRASRTAMPSRVHRREKSLVRRLRASSCASCLRGSGKRQWACCRVHACEECWRFTSCHAVSSSLS